jgi:hypothetical protein
MLSLYFIAEKQKIPNRASNLGITTAILIVVFSLKILSHARFAQAREEARGAGNRGFRAQRKTFFNKN